MARETKTQREIREAIEKVERQKLFVDSYPQRLLNLVFSYSNFGNGRFAISKDDDMFQFSPDNWRTCYVLPMKLDVYLIDYHASVEELEYEVESYLRELEEEKRKEAVRSDALRKVSELFTEEERRLLGLK